VDETVSLDESARRSITLGQIGLSFYRVTGATIQAVLESLGHSVQIEEGTHDEIFPQLAADNVNLLVAAWLPDAHGEYWKKYRDSATQIADLYDDARLYWAVPNYVPQSTVASITDLTNPDVIDRMTDEIVGVGQGPD
jgi:glycine betaine/proline transport system substrate-binding protein